MATTSSTRHTDLAQRRIGDIPVSAICLGGLSWSAHDFQIWRDDMKTIRDVNAVKDYDALGIKTIHAAIDNGVRLIDSAHAYTLVDHPGHSEWLITQALASHPQGGDVTVMTKGGLYRDGDDMVRDGRPEAIRAHCEASLEMLRRDQIDVYFLHHVDPKVPLTTTMKAFADLQEEGLVRYVGMSSVTMDQVREVSDILNLDVLMNPFSPFDQRHLDMVRHCEEHAIPFVGYSPLGGWRQLPGRGSVSSLAEAYPKAAAVAERLGISIHRLVLAWLIRLSPAFIPLVGAGRPETAVDSCKAMVVELTEADLAEIDF